MANVTYWNAVGAAWNRMKKILFQPFNAEKWFIMGFSAWLAGLNLGGGSSSGGGSAPGTSGNPLAGGRGSALAEFWQAYAPVILTVGLFLVVIAVTVALVWAWVNARGRFVFLDNLIHDRAAIVEPWKKYRLQGNSLFLWNLAIGLIGLVFLLLLAFICVPMILPMITAERLMGLGILGILLGVLMLTAYGLVMAYVQLMVNDFVVPIMLKHELRIRAAWAYFHPIVRPHVGSFVLYGLVIFLVNTLISAALFAAVLATCCMLLLILLIPYIGTVALLPAFVFRRWIGIEFLRQFGEDIDSVAAAGDDCVPPAYSTKPL